MDTNTIAFAIQSVTSAPEIGTAFTSGLYFGATVVATLFVFSFIRSITDNGHEEL